MTEAQRILQSLRAERNDPPGPSLLSQLPSSSIARVKHFLGISQPPSAWHGPPRHFTLDGDSIHLQSGDAESTHFDNCPRLPFTSTTYLPCGSDLPHHPVVLTGITRDWKAMEGEGWSLPALAARCKPLDSFSLDGGPGFARESLSSGAVTMGDFANYANPEGGEALGDAAPLYIFDEGLRTRAFACGTRLADEFSIPTCFSGDTVAAACATRPLPPSWLLVGPCGSGTPIHNHPATVGWCTLLWGVKLWVLLPPQTPLELLLVGEHNTESQDEDLSALAWMMVWGQKRTKGGGKGDDNGAVCVLQRPGETVFLPAGWWHCVLNVQGCTTALSHSLYLARDAALLEKEEADALGGE